MKTHFQGCSAPEGGITILKPVIHLESDGNLQFSGLHEVTSFTVALNLKAASEATVIAFSSALSLAGKGSHSHTFK